MPPPPAAAPGAPPRSPDLPHLPAPELPVSAYVHAACPISPLALPPGARRPSLSADPDPKGAGEAPSICSREVPDTLFLAPGIRLEGGARRLEEQRKSATSLRAKMEKGKVFPSRPLPARSVLSQHTAPHNYLPERDRAGPPPPGPQPSQCCRTDTASGFRTLKGCYSPWVVCIRRALGWKRSAPG